ncbi:hypothetical protein FOZ60_006130 [Perkinsus olseni]|uniref:Uncharacterized protein n=1 Tax=Perkinsus olseni TaxID=32597 RepID=A0A7J6PGF4_PEROL|nr:hypothetical protein FOZ60_006130 [Perkinsus olseni]
MLELTGMMAPLPLDEKLCCWPRISTIGSTRPGMRAEYARRKRARARVRRREYTRVPMVKPITLSRQVQQQSRNPPQRVDKVVNDICMQKHFDS